LTEQLKNHVPNHNIPTVVRIGDMRAVNCQSITTVLDWRTYRLPLRNANLQLMGLHCEAKKLHRFIFAIALSELHLL